MIIRSTQKDDLSIGANYFCLALALVFAGCALYAIIG
jgi:hypothetical protein